MKCCITIQKTALHFWDLPLWTERQERNRNYTQNYCSACNKYLEIICQFPVYFPSCCVYVVVAGMNFSIFLFVDVFCVCVCLSSFQCVFHRVWFLFLLWSNTIRAREYFHHIRSCIECCACVCLCIISILIDIFILSILHAFYWEKTRSLFSCKVK